MLFKLSLKNFRKSIRDYAIYFTTLVLGVAIFYVFNALDSQQAMSMMAESKRELLQILVQLLGGVSVFVSGVLAFLIIYANNFLIKRRKKEFGVYMTLGMGKGQISRILVGETFLIGLLSLTAGLVLGVLASQFMTVLIAKMFDEAMEQYAFVFSKAACFKTLLYFCIMFLVVFLFNIFMISKCRLIDLISARKKSEKVRVKNPALCIVLFIGSVLVLGYLYYLVAVTPNELDQSTCITIIAGGIAATFFFFWSLSGFLMEALKKNKNFYLKNLNAFVMRQLNSTINTTVTAMTIICILLFLTICILSSGLGLNYTFRNSLKELTPADVNLIYTPPEGADPGLSVREVIGDETFASMRLEDGFTKLKLYRYPEFTLGATLGEQLQELNKNFRFLTADIPEDIIKLSDYNRLAKLYEHKEYQLEADEYLMICDFEAAVNARNVGLSKGEEIVLGGKTYRPFSKQCESGFLEMSASHVNSGLYVLPDEAVDENRAAASFLAGNYGVKDKQAVETIEKRLKKIPAETGIRAATRIEVRASSVGLSAIVTFLAIYLGIIFLICGAAILALKELSESSDDKERYEILRKIGADEKMVNKALFKQIGVFFLLPLSLAVLHSIFGLEFIRNAVVTMGDSKSFATIFSTAAMLLVVYGGYFLVTYLGSKRIIHGK